MCRHRNLVINRKIERVRAYLNKCRKQTVVNDDCTEIGENGASTSAAITVGHDQECASVTSVVIPIHWHVQPPQQLSQSPLVEAPLSISTKNPLPVLLCKHHSK